MFAHEILHAPCRPLTSLRRFAYLRQAQPSDPNLTTCPNGFHTRQQCRRAIITTAVPDFSSIGQVVSNAALLAKIVPEAERLGGNFTANKLKAMMFPDLATPGTGLLIFAALVLLVVALAQLRVGKDLFNISTTDENIPRNVEELEEAMKIYKEVPPEQQSAEQADVVLELLREKQELLHERERGLVWLAGITLVVFWCAGLVNTL